MASNNKNSLLLFLLLIVALLLNYGFCHQQQDNDSSSPIEQVDDGDDDNNHGNHSAIWWTVFLLSVGCAIICAVLIKGQSEPAEQNANNDQNEGQGDGEIAGGGVNLDDIDMDFIDGEIDYQATWGHNPFEHGGGNLLQNLQEQNIDEQEEEKDPCCPGSQKMVSLMANYVDTFAHSFSKSSLFDRMFPQSLSLSVLWLLALSNFATASGAVQHYDGFKLLRVIPQTLEQLAALRNFSEYVGLQPNSGAEVWNFRPFVGQPSEFFAAPDNAKRVTDFIKFDSIGKTSEGREIPFLTLGYPSKTSKKPALFLDAGIHAREWIAPAIALHFINALINEPKFHSLLSDIDVHVLPSLNPDGYAHTWTKDRLWRRTRSGPIKSNSKVCGSDDSDEEEFCYGVDPNRNFPFHWGQAGVSKCPCSQVYNGERPLSEPECANLAKFISANTGTIKAYLTLHAYSNLIIHPYGFERHFYPENVAEILRVANSMAKAIVQAGGEKFRVGSAPDILYMVSGSSDDFARSAGIKYTYTMELTSGWYGDRYVGFVYPEEGISKEAEQVLPAFLLLAEQVKSESSGKEAEDQKGIGGQ